MIPAAAGRAAGREETTMDLTPQSYPLVVTIGEAQHLVVGWTRVTTGPGSTALAPVTVPLGGPGRPEVHDDDFTYTLPPQVS
jgi:hypothetical protein